MLLVNKKLINPQNLGVERISEKSSIQAFIPKAYFKIVIW